jgi:MFS family permease
VNSTPSDTVHDSAAWRAAFSYRDFNCFQGARSAVMLGVQMQSVAVGWQIYAATGRPIDLAWVGLAQFLPAAGLSLVTGHAADRFDRRRIMMLCQTALGVLALALFVSTRVHGGVGPIYAVLVGIGVARAFLGPSTQSLLPTLVPLEHFGNAVAWSSTFFQIATVVGPSVGGFLYGARGPTLVYGLCAICSVVAVGLVAAMSGTRAPASRPDATRASVFAGVRYVRHNPIVLGAISLDLFAVLLGGATALLPVYARDILLLGPFALGFLRSAPAIGAALIAVALARWPIKRRAGSKMLVCVAVFGAATIVFGLSRSFTLSLAALVIAGAADMVSVFVRSSLVQLATPEAMRGRVSAVNMVFIGASNELGEFESGLTAQWFGTVPAVVLGGIGTLAVVALWTWRFPRLAKVDRLEDVSGEPTPEELALLARTALEPGDPRP